MYLFTFCVNSEDHCMFTFMYIYLLFAERKCRNSTATQGNRHISKGTFHKEEIRINKVRLHLVSIHSKVKHFADRDIEELKKKLMLLIREKWVDFNSYWCFLFYY